MKSSRPYNKATGNIRPTVSRL